MPAAVAAAIEIFAAYLGTEMTLTAAQIYFTSQAIVYTAAYAASSAHSNQQRRKAQASAQAAYLAGLKDRELMIRSAVAPRRVIYGRDKVSGPIVYAQSTGDKGEYLHIVIALAAHECDAIETIYFNDVELPTPDSNGDITSGEFSRSTVHTATEAVTASASITLLHDPASILSVSAASVDTNGVFDQPLTAGQYTIAGRTITFAPGVGSYSVNYTWSDSGQPRVRIRKYLGGTGQAADSALVAASGGKWTAQHRGTGICYLYVRLQFDPEVFGQVGLPAISAVVRGRKVRDPRSGLVVWSDNTALCIADWLRDASVGLRASAAEVPDGEVIAAANICDETVATSASTSQARYNFNGSFTTQQSPRDVLADLLSGMAGHCVWSQGRWLVRAGAARTGTLTIDADKLAGSGVNIVPKASRSDLYNAVRVTYRDPSQAWAEVQAPLVTNATYEAADGGVRIVRAIQLPGAMDALRAQRMGKIELERDRQALTVQLIANLAAYDLAPTDTCYLDLARYGFASKLMEVRQRTWSPDGTLAYTVRETAAGVWAWNFGEATTIDLAPDTTLPSPYAKPAALAGLSVQSGTNHLMRLGDGTITARAWLQWSPSTEAFVLGGGVIEAQWKRLSTNDWQVAPSMPGDAINTYMQPVPDGRVILVRVRAVNSAGRASDWSVVTHLVVGKTAPPADVLGLSAVVVQGGVRVSWTPSAEIDHADTDLRIGATWSSGTPLFRGTSNTYTWPWPAAGTYTLSVKHRDTTGNVSAAAATVSVTVDAAMLVQWANVGGLGRPASYATVGKSLGLPFESWNLNGQTIVDLSDGKVGRSALRLSGSAGNYPNQGNYVAIDRTKKYRVRFWARPMATTAGLLYFSLQQFTDAAGNNGPVNGGRAPYKPSGQTRALHNFTFGGTDQWGEYSNIWDSADWQTGVQFVRPDFLDNYSGQAGYWEVQDFTFEEVTEVVSAKAVADSAVIAAGAAQTSADTANTALTNIASDSILSPGEKPAVVQDYAVITGEQAGIGAQATAYGISTEKTAYDSAVSALTSYLGTLSGWNTVPGSDVAIVGTTFRSNFAGVYTARQTLLNKIAEIAGTKALWTGVASKPGDTDLLNTHTQGGVLVVTYPAGGNYSNGSPGQTGALKIRLPRSWTNTMLRFFVEIYEYSTDRSFTLEVGGYNSSAPGWFNCYARMIGSAVAEKPVRFGHDGTYCCVWIGDPGATWDYPQVAITNFRAAYSSFTEALWASGWQVSLDTSAVAGHAIDYTQANPLTGASWSQIPAGTGKAADNATVGATWGNNLTGQPADSALLNALQTWAQVSGAGRPADNATVGATFGVNISGQAATVDIQNNAVTYTSIYSDSTGVSVCPTC